MPLSSNKPCIQPSFDAKGGVVELNPESTVVLDQPASRRSPHRGAAHSPQFDTGNLGGFACALWGDGFALIGSILFGPRGPTGWLARVDEHLQLQRETFNDQYAPSALIQSDDGGLFILSRSRVDYFILRLRPNGEVLVRHALPAGESHLVHPSDANRSGVSVVSMLSSGTTERLQCDDQ